MSKKKEGRGTYYVVLRGRSPGVYGEKREAMAQVRGLPGGQVKPLYRATRQEAREYFRQMRERGLVQALDERGNPLGAPRRPAPPQGKILRIDGSLKGTRETSSAVVLPREGRAPVAQGEIYLQGGSSSTDAEMRALVLGLLLMSPGDEVEVRTDLEMLERHWKAGGGPPLIQAAKALAEALGLRVTIRKVPRTEVRTAHERANRAREEGEQMTSAVLSLDRLLERIPPNYRHSALEYLSGAAKRSLSGKELLLDLRGRETETARLLLGLIKGERHAEALLRTAAELNGHGQALLQALKERDREKAMALKPPSERQLAFLGTLGYQGPAPANMLEASRLIEELLGQKER